jgi:hypothetical protein
LAIETLITADPKFIQNAHHGLESFLYIILYVCIFMEEPGVMLSMSQVSAVTPLRSWFHPSLEDLGWLKVGDMLFPDRSVMPYFTTYWDGFKPFVSELINACFPGNPADPNNLTHDKMISIPQRAFDTIQEPRYL